MLYSPCLAQEEGEDIIFFNLWNKLFFNLWKYSFNLWNIL